MNWVVLSFFCPSRSLQRAEQCPTCSLLIVADVWVVDDDLNCRAFYECVSQFPLLHFIVFANSDLCGVLQDDVEVYVISYGIAKYHNLVCDSDQNWRSITHGA